MAKRGSRRGKSGPDRIAKNKIIHGLYEVNELLEDERYFEARSMLQNLDEQFPDNVDVLRELVNVCLDLDDTDGYQYAIERLSNLLPDDCDVALGLADAYMANFRLMLAFRGFHHFLERWPDDERAAEVRETIADLEPVLSQSFSAMGFTEAEMYELGPLHDESQVLMDYGRYSEARRMAEELIIRKPKFTAARNNLSLIWALEGNLEKAITVAEETLKIKSDNYHTLGNLVCFHVQSGQIEQARQYADQLEAVVDEEMTDIWLKKIEALSYLGDDSGILSIFKQAQESEHQEDLNSIPIIFHYAAVAEMRLGNEKRARTLWRQALKIFPGLEIAQANLDDLSNPAAVRHAPWPFPLINWVSRQTVQGLISCIESRAERDDDQAVTDAVRGYIDQHPEIKVLVPILFDRGDPIGRELAMQLTDLGKTPEMLAALRDFALSKCGPDEMRMRAAQIAREAGLFPEGPVRLWQQGKWSEFIQTLSEIHYEPLFNHGPEVSKLLVKGIEYMRKEDGVKSERLFKQALELEPDAPDILNNLAKAYGLQGLNEQGERLIRQIYKQYPDYIFGIVNMAGVHIYHREFDKAEELLKPLLSRKRLHHDELIAVIEANINLYLAQGKPDSAQTWIDMWEQFDPDDPRLQKWLQQVEMLELPEGIGRYLERNKRR